MSRTTGEAVCRNRALVFQLLAFVKDGLKSLPSSSVFDQAFLDAFKETLAARPAQDVEPTLADAARVQEDRVARLVDGIADGGGSPVLAARLKDEEAKLEAIQTKLATTQLKRSRLTSTSRAQAAGQLSCADRRSAARTGPGHHTGGARRDARAAEAHARGRGRTRVLRGRGETKSPGQPEG